MSLKTKDKVSVGFPIGKTYLTFTFSKSALLQAALEVIENDRFNYVTALDILGIGHSEKDTVEQLKERMLNCIDDFISNILPFSDDLFYHALIMGIVEGS
ncbi:MAG: hypothetical protein JXM69_00775 [Anaerolineae bacterium]|nr:hypothetical protein [Anaerolineae bacterium]